MNPTVLPSALDPGDDLRCCSLDPHYRTVDAKIVVLRRTPISAGIGVIVFFPLLINFSDLILRFFLSDTFDLHSTPDPFLKGCADEQADCRDTGSAEDYIRAPSHDNTGILLGKLQNHLALHLKQDVLRRLSLSYLGAALLNSGIQPGIRGLFFPARKQFLPQFSPLCRQSDQLPVIAPDIQFLRQPLSDFPAAAAELAAKAIIGIFMLRFLLASRSMIGCGSAIRRAAPRA